MTQAPDLPTLALSIRQPSAWAILHGGKDIENRSHGSVRAGRMMPGRICLHAARGLTEAEFRYVAWRMQEVGVICPAPADLPRGAIIGTIDVVEIVSHSDSPWYGGAAGLRLANPLALDRPIPAARALGYFTWEQGGALAEPLAWMDKYAASSLFGQTPLQFETPPKRPWPKLEE